MINQAETAIDLEELIPCLDPVPVPIVSSMISQDSYVRNNYRF